MTGLFRGLFAVSISALMVSRAHAGLIAQWNFSVTNASAPVNYAAASTDTTLFGTPGLSSSGGRANASVTGGPAGLLQYSYNGNPNKLNGTVISLTLQAGGANFSSFAATYDAGFNNVTGL